MRKGKRVIRQLTSYDVSRILDTSPAHRIRISFVDMVIVDLLKKRGKKKKGVLLITRIFTPLTFES